MAISRSVSPATAVAEQQTPPEPTDASSTATAKHESTEDIIPADAHNPSVPGDGDKSQEQAESPPELVTPLKKHVLYSIIIIAITGLFALSAACWLVAFIQTKVDGGYIKAVRIGGNVSSTWAKLIDAAASMLVAPAILAITNWHMFKLARLSAVNEHDKRDSKASLNVLVEVAGTDWGSTSPLKFWTFLQSQKPRIICLGVISILSALSFSLLSNVTAYEEAGSVNTTTTLEAMKGMQDYFKQPLRLEIKDSERLQILNDSWLLGQQACWPSDWRSISCHVFEQALTWDEDELDAWVETVELQYEPAEGHGEASVTEDGDYDCCMRLRQIPRSSARD
ncbi:hypothetical protein NCS55_00198300 [Fusarium keratoplasticum]|nr:hypothetical protein NCS55_00198300 [Fusarium keratoplasticum]